MVGFSGKWVSARKSVLELKQDGASLSGTFDSGVADEGVMKVPVVGWANGDRIAFTASYEKYGTVVAWVGQLTDEEGRSRIEAQFLHGADVTEENEAEFLWAATRIGSDVFVKA